MSSTLGPTHEEFQALQDSFSNLVSTCTATASSDLALLISIIGHLSSHAVNPGHAIESIGFQATGLIKTIIDNPTIPESMKKDMSNRINNITEQAQKLYGRG